MNQTTDSDKIISELARIVGATHVSSAPADVEAYGGLEPFVVVWPGSPTEVGRVLKACRQHWVAAGIAGYGARASRHWPVSDGRLRVALDTRRMTNILDLDELALTVHCQCGIRMRHLEEALRRQGLSLGPYPAETHVSTLGGLLSAPSPTAHSPQAGWLKNACLSLTIAQPDGTLVQTRVAPRKATGPDISRFYIGCRGGMGVITTATLRVHRLPELERVVALATPDAAAAVSLARQALAAGLRPARLRALGRQQALAELGEDAGPLPAALLAVLAGPPALVEEEQRQLISLARRAEGRELSGPLAERWWARHSAWREPGEGRACRVGARVRHSRFAEVLDPLPAEVDGLPLHSWCEEFTLQGGTLWLSCAGLEEAQPRLRSLLLDAGLDPLRFDFPPLMDELRRQLDPDEIMVIMEGEWSGS